MKRYRLLKDLPFAKAGEIFKEWTGERYGKKEKALVNTNNLTTTLWVGDIEIFDEWFEKDKEEKFSERIFYILPDGGVDSIETVNYSNTEDNRQEYKKYKEKLKSVGNCFETREEAEEYFKYLKAKTIIKQDTKGFKPDWTNYDEQKYLGFWDIEKDNLDWLPRNIFIEATIYFKSREDIEESFKKHPNEWRTYLTYEQ
jgi:hypothetical protein